jgi:hypothetical protein
MTPPRLVVVAAASAVVLAACGPAGTATTTSATSSTAAPVTTAPTSTRAPSTTTPPTTVAPTTAAPEGPLVLLDAQPILRGNLYTNPGAVVVVDGTWHMFRNQFSAWPGKSTTYHLVSSDGLEWEDRGPVFDSDAVSFTDGNAFVMDVVAGEDGWVGWFYTYEGSREPGFIGRVTAPGPDGPWVPDPEPVLSPGPEGAWDGVRVIEPTVVVDDDRYLMYYAGIGDDRTSAIGLATSEDGITWTKHDDPGTEDPRLGASDPVLTGDADSWNVGSIGCPDVEWLGDGFMMIFDSAAAKGYARAVSADGVRWEIVDEDTLIRQDTAPGRQPFWQSELVPLGDAFRWYLEVGLGTGPTNIFAFDLEVPHTP